MQAYVIVDLGFGDSGKGLLTDYLVRHFKAGVVVRYNGGAQAGHNVVTPDGHHHTFSQFGSGAFNPDVKTYLSRHVVIHPTALLVEGDILEKKGVRAPFSRLRVSDQALVITPFHQAANRIRETARGANRHGSCGVGVGETVEDALSNAENRILAGDLTNPTRLKRKLQSVREQKREQIRELCQQSAPEMLRGQEYSIFEREDVIDTWISSVSRIVELGLIGSDEELERWLHETDHVVFEGAQGVLIDAEAGFHPYTTWSDCTATNALEIIKQMAPDSDSVQIGVMRCYAVRHGPGPLPTETNLLASVIAEHNNHNEWQGPVRYGWFDAVLVRYALSVTGGIDFLAVTHLDILPHLESWKYCASYTNFSGLYDSMVSSTNSDNDLTSFRLPHFLSLEERAQLTEVVSAVTPVLKTCNPDDKTVIREIEALVGRPVGIVSRGPSAQNVQLIDSLPL